MLEHKIQDYPLKAPVLSYVGDDVLSEYGVMLENAWLIQASHQAEKAMISAGLALWLLTACDTVMSICS